MSDIGELYAALKEVSKVMRAANRTTAVSEFPTAKVMASRAGMVLRKCSDVHYQLRHEGKLLNIYPGKRRLFADKKLVFPFLTVPADWGLLDVVTAAVGEIYGLPVTTDE